MLSFYTFEGEVVVDDGQRSVAVSEGMKARLRDGSVEDPVPLGPGDPDESYLDPYQPYLEESLLDELFEPITNRVLALGPLECAAALSCLGILGLGLVAGLVIVGRRGRRRRPAPGTGPSVASRTPPMRRPGRAPAASVPQTWATLTVTEVNGQLRTIRLSKPIFTIGRGSSSDASLADGRVSRRHAEIRRVPGKVMIRDMGSTNGLQCRCRNHRPSRQW